MNLLDANTAKAQKYNEAGIQFFRKFLLSFEKSGEMPSQIEDVHVRPFIVANLYIARSLARTRVTSIDKQVECQVEGLKIYRRLHEYMTRNADQVENPDNGVVEEVAICRNMIQLLPQKIDLLAKRRA